MAFSIFHHKLEGQKHQSTVPKRHGMDMCNGPLGVQIILYVIPLILTCLLQFTFHAADIIVVGRYASHRAMAAVGSCGAFSHIMITFYLGLSTGINVIAARAYGAKDNTTLANATHTAILTGFLCGLLGTVITFIIARPVLKLMQTPDDVINLAARYMHLYGLGLPFMMVNTFGSSVLRAAGDTKRPMYFLMMGGIANVLLNMLLVIVFHWDVEGVAVATAVSQVICASLTVLALKNANDASRLHLKKLRIHKNIFLEMLRIGIPSGFQSSFFSLSNMVIQSSVNSFGSLCMAGCAAASNVEGIAYSVSASYYHTSQAFVGQNYGGRNIKRIKRSIFLCAGGALLLGTTLGLIMIGFGRPILGFYNSNPEVIEWGMKRLYMILCYYGICAVMDVESGSLRALGYSTIAMVSTLLGSCVLRVIWVMTVFQWKQSLSWLIACYPVSWLFTSFLSGFILYHAYKKTKRLFLAK